MERPAGDITLEFLDLRYKRFLDVEHGIQFDVAESPGVYIDIHKVVCIPVPNIVTKMIRALYHRTI